MNRLTVATYYLSLTHILVNPHNVHLTNDIDVCKMKRPSHVEKLRFVQQMVTNNVDKNRYTALLKKLQGHEENIGKLKKSIKKLASLTDSTTIERDMPDTIIEKMETNNKFRVACDKYEDVTTNLASKQDIKKRHRNECKLLDFGQNTVTSVIEKLEKYLNDRKTNNLIIQARIYLLKDKLIQCREKNEVKVANIIRIKEKLKEMVSTIIAQKEEFVDKKALIEKLHTRIVHYEKRYSNAIERSTCY